MQFISTRGNAAPLTFDDAVLAGLARDGGLYVPEAYPQLSATDIADLAGQPFSEIAYRVLEPYVRDCVAAADLRRMVEGAYDTFGHPAVTPLVQVGPDTFVLELFHGPTLAFKDVAMRLLARLMDHILAQRGTRATVVAATSGDTGGAAIDAFRGSQRVDVVILYPEGRVSDVQRRMMTTPTDANVVAAAVAGTFDDCQALVKAMFNHHQFRDSVALAGVNSINWARILAQVTYYFAAGAALGAPHRPLSFAVPTGNFGDIFAGYVATRMGLPVETLTIASNANDILPRALATGVYAMNGVVPTSSPSMDIQVSSNFERLLFEAGARDAALIRRQMAALAETRHFELSAGQRQALSARFRARSAQEADVATTIRETLAATGYLLDPHTACGVFALESAATHAADGRGHVPQVVLATAHPAKFPDAMQEITGARPALPARLAGLMTAPERTTLLPNDLASVEAFVASRTRATTKARP